MELRSSVTSTVRRKTSEIESYRVGGITVFLPAGRPRFLTSGAFLWTLRGGAQVDS
jgi:hypothetical protein